MALDFLTIEKSIKPLLIRYKRCRLAKKNPIAYKIRMIVVTNKSKINLNLTPGGGTAISFEPIQ